MGLSALAALDEEVDTRKKCVYWNGVIEVLVDTVIEKASFICNAMTESQSVHPGISESQAVHSTIS